jgi:hypothetical protein
MARLDCSPGMPPAWVASYRPTWKNGTVELTQYSTRLKDKFIARWKKGQLEAWLQMNRREVVLFDRNAILFLQHPPRILSVAAWWPGAGRARIWYPECSQKRSSDPGGTVANQI